MLAECLRGLHLSCGPDKEHPKSSVRTPRVWWLGTSPLAASYYPDSGDAAAVPRCSRNGHTSHATPSGPFKAALCHRPLPTSLRIRDPASPYSRRDGSQGGRQEIAWTPHPNHRTWQPPTLIWQYGKWLQSAKFWWESLPLRRQRRTHSLRRLLCS